MTSINAHVYAAAVPEIKDVKGKVISKGNKKDRLNFKSLSEKYHVAINAIRARSDLPKMSFKDKFFEFFGLKCAFIHINNEAGKKIWLKINVNSLIKRFGIEKHEINAILKHSQDRNITVYLNAKIQGLLPPRDIKANEIEIEKSGTETTAVPAANGTGAGILDEFLELWDKDDGNYLIILEKICLSGEVPFETALQFLNARLKKNSPYFLYPISNKKTVLGKQFSEKNPTLWKAFIGDEAEPQLPQREPTANQDEIEIEVERETQPEPAPQVALQAPKAEPAANQDEEDSQKAFNELFEQWNENIQQVAGQKNLRKNAEIKNRQILEKILTGKANLTDKLAIKFFRRLNIRKDSPWFFQSDRITRNNLGEFFYQTNRKLWDAFMGIKEPMAPQLPQPEPAPQAEKEPMTLNEILSLWDHFAVHQALRKGAIAKEVEDARYELLRKIFLSGEVPFGIGVQFVKARKHMLDFFFIDNTDLGKEFAEKNPPLWNELMAAQAHRARQLRPRIVAQQAPKVEPAARKDEIEPLTLYEILKAWDKYAGRYAEMDDDKDPFIRAAKAAKIEVLKKIFLSGEVSFEIALQFLKVRGLGIKRFFDANGERIDLGKEFAEKNPPLWAEFMKIQPQVPPPVQLQPAIEYIHRGDALRVDIPYKTPLSFQEIMKNSEAFYNALTTEIPRSLLPKDNWIAELHKLAVDKAFFEKEIEDHANATRIVLDKKLLEDIVEFLNNKKQNGNAIEKNVYEKMTPLQFIQRLITKRPLLFDTSYEGFMLRPEHGCAQGSGTSKQCTIEDPQGKTISLFKRIGTVHEGVIVNPTPNKNRIIPYVILKNYLSYPEMEIAQRMQVAGPSHLIKAGAKNMMNMRELDSFEEKALIIGAEGCRYKKAGQWQSKPPYWKTKLDEDDLVDDYQFIQSARLEKGYFNKVLFKQRMQEIYRSILITANDLGKNGPKVVVQMKGLGLGMWILDGELQKQLTLEAIQEILLENNFDRIAAINLGWIADQNQKAEKIGGVHIYYQKNHPGRKLDKESGIDLSGLQSVIVYDWDSVSYVGNQYWIGLNDGDRGSAYASFSTIGELHNPDINPWFLNNILITGVKEDEVEKYKNLLHSEIL